MKVEKIELSGFKSFAERTSIHLHRGITGIAGPNGCGKSNIVDAIKWLFGEQSPKSLRGEKMEELVFNGSQTRKPKGMAEVSIYISGIPSPGVDNGDSDGITVITRRIYRSGDSEYAINNTPCRLKDIRELLLDTGLDVKNYFIFEQERISQLINSKPEERRFLIEEIAGIIKYKVKKAEALQKLEQSRINLQRINDILNEVKRQLNSLDRQVKRAEKFKKLSEERKTIELYLAKIQFTQMKEALQRLMQDFNSLKEEEAAKKAKLSSIDNTIGQGRLLLIGKEKALSTLYESLEQKERIISQNEKTIIQDELNAESYKKEVERLTLQRQENTRLMDELRQKISVLIQQKDSLGDELGRIGQEMDRLSLRLSTSEKEIIDVEHLIEEKRKSLFRLSDDLSHIINDRTRLNLTLESLNRRELALQKELEEIQLKTENIQKQIDKITEEIKFSSEELISLKDREDDIISEIETLNEQIELKRQELQDVKEKLASNLSRLESLKELILNETTAHLFRDVQSLSLLGFLSDLFEVPERYEKAIEAVLAEEISTFIIANNEDLKRAISIIKEQETSRASFFSAEFKSLFLNVDEEINVPEGYIKAMEAVKILDSSFTGLLRSLLGRTIITESIEDAMRIKDKGYEGSVATIEGDFIDEVGIVWSGRGRDVLRRKREIKELERSIEDMRAIIDRKTDEFHKLKGRLSEKESDLNRIEGLIDEEEARLTELRHILDTTEHERERLQKRSSYLHLEKEDVQRERTINSEDLIKMNEEISKFEEKRNILEAEIENLKNDLLLKRQNIESLRQEYTDFQMKHTRIVENYNSVIREIETAQKILASTEKKNEELLWSIEKMNTEVELLIAKVSDLKVQTSELAKEVTIIKEKVSLERQEIEQENQRLLNMEEGIKSLRGEIEELMAKINGLDVERAETVVRLDGIRDGVLVNYGINIEELNEEELFKDDVTFKELSVEELSERLNSIRKKIDELGPVNLGTLEEYEELKERYKFLSLQHEDLTRSIAELEEAIGKINTTTKQRLRDAFDALNEKFGEVFVRLFGGGRASILLTDEKNILESGIDIIAQPPGKRLQNINLLSGGEKALTALSLLVASFLIKPAPLCVLDEADAPLDDSNIERFARMIKELSKNIQFIIITHNKATMFYCDYLYGVTMEEPGISKVISLQLEQNKGSQESWRFSESEVNQ